MSFETQKRCSKCKQIKTHTDFSYRDKEHKYLNSWCKQCNARHSKKWRKRNVKLSRELSRQARYKDQFGITIDDYDKMFLAQDGVCAICGEAETTNKHGNVQRLSVDHNHKTGKIRGLLCARCNGLVLPIVENQNNLIVAAIKYLRDYDV